MGSAQGSVIWRIRAMGEAAATNKVVSAWLPACMGRRLGLPASKVGPPLSMEPGGFAGSCGFKRHRCMQGPAVATQKLLLLSSTASFSTPPCSQASSSLTRVPSCVLQQWQKCGEQGL